MSEINKDTQVYISYIARFKERELVQLLMTEDRYMTYSTYKKKELEYGPINESSFNNMKRLISRGSGECLASQSKEEVTESYREYLIELKAKREKAYIDAERKLRECNDMLEYIESI